MRRNLRSPRTKASDQDVENCGRAAKPTSTDSQTTGPPASSEDYRYLCCMSTDDEDYLLPTRSVLEQFLDEIYTVRLRDF